MFRAIDATGRALDAIRRVPADAKVKVLVSRDRWTTCDDRGIVLLYPDIRTHHAVVNRLKAGAPR